MGIDGIGKPPGAPPPTVGSGSTGGVPGSSFEVRKASDAAKVEATKVEASQALSALSRGELSLEQYLDVRVEEAVSHLKSQLPAEQLDFVRGTLRAQLESDPVLVELVRRATESVQTTSR
jgi:hypothetical protein